VWGSDRRVWIRREFRPELWMRERRPEVGSRLPNGIVQISRAFANRTMQLRRDESRLPLHERRIGLPGLQEALLVGFIEREHIHQDGWRGVDCDLAFDRECRVQRAQQRHRKSPLSWFSHTDMI